MYKMYIPRVLPWLPSPVKNLFDYFGLKIPTSRYLAFYFSGSEDFCGEGVLDEEGVAVAFHIMYVH